jgi:hypothetical protein
MPLPSLIEKPVLLVNNYREGMRIPSVPDSDNTQHMKTTIRVKADGSAEGDVQIDLKGITAVAIRSIMRVIPNGQEDLFGRKMLEGSGFHGTAKLHKSDPSELLDTYSFKITFKIEDLFVASSTIGMPIRPVISTPSDVASNLASVYEPVSKRPQTCIGGKTTEEYVYEFPQGMTLLATPKNVDLNTTQFIYRASYNKNGTTLNVVREFTDKAKSVICKPAQREEYNKSARAVVQDVKSQVLISN